MAETPYDFLLNHILLGEYPPGAGLIERDIAKELGLSRTPVREALLRLKAEGLVNIIPHGGIFVAEASVQLIREVTDVRLVLEEYLAHLVVERRTEEWLKSFEQWLDNLTPTWRELSPQEWMKNDWEFHQRLDAAARKEILSNHLSLLRRQAVLFWGQSSAGRASLEGIIFDFKETLSAVRDRNFEACAQVFRKHVLDHVERIRQYMKPEEFRPNSVTLENNLGGKHRALSLALE